MMKVEEQLVDLKKKCQGLQTRISVLETRQRIIISMAKIIWGTITALICGLLVELFYLR